MRNRGRPAIMGAFSLFLAFTIGLPNSAAVTVADFAPLVRVSGDNPYASCPPAEARPGVEYPSAEVEPQIAVDPTTIGTVRGGHLVGVWQQDRWSNGGAQGIVAGISSDGGRTWRQVPLPFSTCVPGGLGYNRASDPWVAIGPDRTVYASAVGVIVDVHASQVGLNARVALGGVVSAVSHDGGSTWSALQTLPNSAGGGDGAHVVVDPGRSGVAYMVWTRSQTTLLSRTVDSGKSWSTPRAVVFRSPHHQNQGGFRIAVDGRTHVLHDIGEIFRNLRRTTTCCQVNGRRQCGQVLSFNEFVVESSSSDAGMHWSKPEVVGRVHPLLQGRTPAVRDPNSLDVAMDSTTGRLYALWEDAGASGGRYKGMLISSSGDGGRHWSRPRGVPIPPKQDVVIPALAVAANGAVGVSYYTLPLTGPHPSHLPTDYWFARSHDQGRHFDPTVHLAGPFDLTTAPMHSFVGDYQGLTAVGNTFQPFFAMANSGDTANPTDIFSTAVSP